MILTYPSALDRGFGPGRERSRHGTGRGGEGNFIRVSFLLPEPLTGF